jgi:hypothetical protein
MDGYWAFNQVQDTFDGVDRLFFSSFVRCLMMIGPGPPFWRKARCTFEEYTELL